MSLFVRSILRPVRQPAAISSLASAFRSLSVTTLSLQRKTIGAAALQTLPKSLPEVTSNIQTKQEEQKKCKEILKNVTKLLAAGGEGRTFAVVHLCGKQFKVTPGDIILVEGYWPPNAGDEILLEKVLLAGAKDFTLIGRPILESGLVKVKATVIEKTLTHTKTHFKKKRRKQYMRINFQRSPNTMIRINTIEIARKVDAASENICDVRLF